MRFPFRHLRHWIAELLLVFIGVYAAFWLNSLQQHREDLRRRAQLIAALETEAQEAMANATQGRAENIKARDELRRALAAGEMPPLGTFSFVTDYNPSDTATLLQSGGYQLLDIKTLIALRNVESVLRAGYSNITHIERLSDELIAPNLDQDITFFYDPATKKLRKRFARYPDALDILVRFFDDYIAAEQALLIQLQAEHHRR